MIENQVLEIENNKMISCFISVCTLLALLGGIGLDEIMSADQFPVRRFQEKLQLPVSMLEFLALTSVKRHPSRVTTVRRNCDLQNRKCAELSKESLSRKTISLPLILLQQAQQWV